MLNQTEEIKARIDLVEVIQEYIKLTPAGVNNFRALCPFHNEKTPSMMISKDKQIWHCFGCGEGGDVFTWLQKMEGMDFPEALRVLAKKANIKLEYHQPEMSTKKTKLLDINKQAVEYWHNLLLKDPNAEPVRKYLEGRQLKQETILEWQLGWAKDSWDDLFKYLKSLGYEDKDILDAGIVSQSQKDNKYYDRFRNRLIFPINNHHGQPVGCSARTMSGEDAKYINTPQTQVYNKSYILFGLDKAKQYMKRQDYTILVEGNMDVIAVSQAGTKNVVAVSGTALTLEQIHLLKRYSKNVMIAFDADQAGQRAALRGLDLAWQEGLNVKIIVLKAGKDPDECIKQDKQLWLDSIKGAVNIIDYYFDITLKDLDLTRADHKKKAAAVLLPIIAKLPDAIDRTHYIQKLASFIAVDDKILEDKINSLKTDKKSITVKQSPQPSIQNIDTIKMLTERVLALLLSDIKLLADIEQRLMPEDFYEDAASRIYKELIIQYNKGTFDNNQVNLEELFKTEPELLKRSNVLFLLAGSEFGNLTELAKKRELEQLVDRFKVEGLRVKASKLDEAIKTAEASGDDAKVNNLLNEKDKVNKDINRLLH
ncbi:DNA primase [Patescibacteria group bacterium]|nr:DNA primase [Patescibacteria group bacterium]